MVQDDDPGALAASFNCMQAGLAERQRLQAAFGPTSTPALAARLLEQADDIFTRERRQVTVMFVGGRDFTRFAEANTAEDTVARLNALFEIVVAGVVDAGGVPGSAFNRSSPWAVPGFAAFKPSPAVHPYDSPAGLLPVSDIPGRVGGAS